MFVMYYFSVVKLKSILKLVRNMRLNVEGNTHSSNPHEIINTHHIVWKMVRQKPLTERKRTEAFKMARQTKHWLCLPLIV